MITLFRAGWVLLLAFGLCAGVRAEVWGPVLGNVTPTSIQIAWRDGDTPSAGVTFGRKTYAGTPDGAYRLVTLSKLKPDTAYRYTFDRNGTTERYDFHTAPAKPLDFMFAVIGDTRTQVQVHRNVVQKVIDLKPRFVINTGDLVAEGSKPAEWDTFFDIERALTAGTPYFAAAGNHEQNADAFFRLFPGGGETARDHYALTYGNTRVIVLNSTRDIPGQTAWLEKTLTAATPATWTVVAFHYPPFTSSGRAPNTAVIEQWVPLLEAHHVDVVFLGHDHYYERSEHGGVQYIIAGGGGAPLYGAKAGSNPYQKVFYREHHYLRVDVTATAMHLRMFRMDGTVGDDVLLKKNAPAVTQPAVTSRPTPVARFCRWVGRWAFPLSLAPAFDRSILPGAWVSLGS